MIYTSPDDLLFFRRRLSLTQAQAAQALGVCTRTWRRYEAGERLLEASPKVVWTILERWVIDQ